MKELTQKKEKKKPSTSKKDEKMAKITTFVKTQVTKRDKGSIILPCDCIHEEQDRIYGKGRRLHTVSKCGKKAYCTVCSPRNRCKITIFTAKNANIGMTSDCVPPLARKYKSI